MTRRTATLAALSLLTGIATAAPRPSDHDDVERWVGAVHYLGAEWPLHVRLSRDPYRAALSFPALGVAGLDARVREEGTELVIELPYGLGEQRLHLGDDVLRTEADPKDRNSVSVVLTPDPLEPPRQVPLGFESGGARIAGSLWIPGGVGDDAPPVVVVGHGAARFERRMPEYRFWAEHLTRRGYAVYLYDKRGVGESEGSYAGASLEQLTRDLEGAVRTAAGHPATDGTRVALLGGSQFGWLALRAARSLDVSAIVLSAPPAVDPATLEIRVLTDELRRHGLEGADLADAVAYVRLYFAAARHPVLFDALLALAEDAEDSNWIGLVPVPESADDLGWWGEHASFDPVPDIAAYDGPLFVAYGREDRIANPEINALPFEHLVPDRSRLTLWLADEADHRLEVPSRMEGDELRFPQLAPGYLERIDAFLRRTLVDAHD